MSPAGTIIACNLCVTNIVCPVVRGIVSFYITAEDAKESLSRCFPILILAIAIAFCYNPAKNEFYVERESRRSINNVTLRSSSEGAFGSKVMFSTDGK